MADTTMAIIPAYKPLASAICPLIYGKNAPPMPPKDSIIPAAEPEPRMIELALATTVGYVPARKNPKVNTHIAISIGFLLK